MADEHVPTSPDEESTDIHLTVPASVYDRWHAEARRERVTIPELVRRAVARNLGTQNRHEPPDE